MPRLFIDIEARFAQFQDSLNRIEKETASAANNMRGAFSKLKGELAAIGAVLSAGGFAATIIKETKEAEQASNRLNAVLKATGGVAGLTRRELDDMAESLSKVSEFDDDGIRNAQAQLIKFGNINKEVFEPALKLSADLAAFMGTEIPEAAQKLGKALQSPKEGINALEREIGELDPAVKKLIEKNVEQNRLMQAQGLILDELKRKVGGTANTMNTGLTKAINDLTKAWGDLNKAIGKEGKTPVVNAMEHVTNELKLWKRVIEEGDWFDKLLTVLGAPARITGIQPGAVPNLPPEGLRQSVTGRIMPHIPGLSDIEEFERAHAAADAPPGFKTPEEYARYLKEKKEEADRILREWFRDQEEVSRRIVEGQEEFAQIRTEASQALANVDIENAKRAEEIARRSAEGAQQFSDALNAPIVEAAENVQDLADAMVYTFDTAGNRIQMLRSEWDKLQEQSKKGSDVARELGMTFQSAFEQAIIEGEKLRDVLRGILQDILRIILRKNVTEPLAAAVSKVDFSGMFSSSGSSGSATGGTVDFSGVFAEGTPFVPRTGIALVHRGERIIPADENNSGTWGTTVIQQTNHFHGDLRAAVRMEVGAMMPQITEASRRGVMEARARGRG